MRTSLLSCFKLRCLFLAVITTLAGVPLALAEEGFEPLFDGRSLNGWHKPLVP